MAAEEIELLERVLLRLGCADTDDKLEACVGRFLTPVILKITSPHDTVRNKVVEVLTHIKRRLSSRPLVQIPVEALIDQYKASSNSPFLQNFAIIFITMGYPRLNLETRSSLAAKLIGCEDKLESYQDKLFMLILSDLNEIKLPDDPAQRKEVLKLDDKPEIKKNFMSLLQDVLLLPYGVTQDQDVPPPGMSPYSFKRIINNNWKAEELENIKKGIVRFICSGIFSDIDIFLLLVIASSDTRFSVATPAIAELSKVVTILDFTDSHVTMPLYTLFSGNNSNVAERKTTPSCARVRQKLLVYLIKCRGKGISVPKGIQVVFEGLFGANTNQKCKVLSLQFAENLIKEGPSDIITKVSKVLLTGFSKLVGKDSNEPNDVQNAAYSALAQLSRSCPTAVNQDLKIVLSYFNHLTNSPPDLHSSIREALVAMSPAFAWKPEDHKKNEDNEEAMSEEVVQLTGQQHLLLAMLSDNAESKLQIVQNVSGIFLTTCYPEYYAPARYLLLLIAGERNSLRENVTSYLYGVSKKDHINYQMLSSIEFLHEDKDVEDFNKLISEQRHVILPSFKSMMRHVNEIAEKRLKKNLAIVVGRTKLPFSLEVYEEILDYLRICLWYSAGARCAPGDSKYQHKLKKYILCNYEESENNELHQYLLFIQKAVEARRHESNLLCLYDLLNAQPAMLCKSQMHLLEPLSNSLKDVSEVMRSNVAQIVGILWAYGFNEPEFNAQISDTLKNLPQKSLEHKHGWLLVLGHAFSRIIQNYKENETPKDLQKWPEFVDAIKVIAEILVKGPQDLLISAAAKCFSMISKWNEIPNVQLEITFQTQGNDNDDDDDEAMTEYTATGSTKFFIFTVVHRLLKSSSVRPKIRAEAAKCLGNLAIGDGQYFTQRNLDKFLDLAKIQKDAALNIAISDAMATTLCGYDINEGIPSENFVNPHCNDELFEKFLNRLIRLVPEPNPQCRQSCSVWLLAVVKNCSYRPAVLNKKQMLQYAFTELLSDDSEFVQDVASRGLGLVYNLSDPNSQNDLANSLLDQLMGGKRKVNKVNEDTELFAEGMLGKTPTGGNITTYKELCSLASDLNQPEMIYQFMQLANHNASWTSKLGAAFGLKSLSSEQKAKMQPYFGKIIPRLYRYKYDPTPKIQNSMISIWDSIVTEPKEVVEQYYWEILRELLDNLTFNEWRVRIACCLAVRDLLRRPNGLRLRTEEKNRYAGGSKSPSKTNAMEVDEVPEPELKELWCQLFRVMDDIHEGTRLAAEGTALFLSKLCVTAASSDHGKSGTAVASSILPFLLETGVTHTVADIRKISIKTISEMIDSSGALIAPHLPSLIPCLLKATGELESTKLSYLSTRLGADHDAQEKVDSLRAEAAKSHHTTETTAKCVRFVDYAALEKMTPAVLDIIKTSVNLGSKIAAAHLICLISIRLGKEMTPLVGKYLGACFVGIKDRNATVRKYYASAIGHLVGIAKEQSIRNLFIKLDESYMENTSNRTAVILVLQSINKRHNELIKDYLDNALPLIFFAMHEEQSEENKATIESWKDLWNEVSSGDAGIRMNLNVIVPKLEQALNDASWSRKAQSANAIKTIAKRLKDTLEEKDRLRLINLLINGLQGRTFQGKERLLQALAALCKGLDPKHEICEKIVEAAMKECRKEEPQYRTLVLSSLGDILEELEVDRFEEVYNMLWYILDKKALRKLSTSDDDGEEDETDLTTDERNRRATVLNKLKENVCETLGKSWPRHSLETQTKYQQLFAERCSTIIVDNTRPVQVALMIALAKFTERLQILSNQTEGNEDANAIVNKEKKVKVDKEMERNVIVEKICQDVLSAVTYASGIPHTGLKKEALSIVLILIKRLSEAKDMKHLTMIKQNFDENLPKFQKDSAPEVRCRIKDIEEKLSKSGFQDH